MSKWPPLLEGFGSALSHPSCRYKIVWNSACYREAGGNSTENKQEIQASFLPTWRDLKVVSFESTKQHLSAEQQKDATTFHSAAFWKNTLFLSES